MKKTTGFEKGGPLDKAIENGSQAIQLSSNAIAIADKTYGDGLPWNKGRVASGIRRDGEQWEELNADIGKKLCWGRARMPHGEFERWVTDEAGTNLEAARWFMRCFEYNTETDKHIRNAIGKTKSRHLYLLPDKILERVRDQYEKTGKIGGFTLEQIMEMATREVCVAIRKTRDENQKLRKQHEKESQIREDAMRKAEAAIRPFYVKDGEEIPEERRIVVALNLLRAEARKCFVEASSDERRTEIGEAFVDAFESANTRVAMMVARWKEDGDFLDPDVIHGWDAQKQELRKRKLFGKPPEESGNEQG